MWPDSDRILRLEAGVGKEVAVIPACESVPVLQILGLLMLLGLNKLSLFDRPGRYYPHNPNLSRPLHPDRWAVNGPRLPANPQSRR